jgi:hypothetical protein
MTKDTFDVPADMKTYTFHAGPELQRLTLDMLKAGLRAAIQRGLRPPDQVILTTKELDLLRCAEEEEKAATRFEE